MQSQPPGTDDVPDLADGVVGKQLLCITLGECKQYTDQGRYSPGITNRESQA